MKRLSLFAVSVMAITFSAAFWACDSEDKKEYEATITWTVGGEPSCTSTRLDDHGGIFLEFAQMEIIIYEDEADATDPEATPVAKPIVPCDPKEYTVRKLKRGTYWVVVGGLADPYLDGERLPYYQGAAELVVPTDEKLAISLQMGKGTVEVGWDFPQFSCVQNGVTEVQITLQSGSVTRTPPEGTIPCANEIYRFSDLTWGLYTLTVEGYGADGSLTHRGDYVAPNTQPVQDTDTLDLDGGVITDTDVAPESPGNELDVRPGKVIPATEAFVVLSPIVP